MNNQNQFKFLNKKVSTSTKILIIALITIAGILGWQYFNKIEMPLPEKKIISTETIDKFMNTRIKKESKINSYFLENANIINLTFGKIATTFSKPGKRISEFFRIRWNG